MSMQRVVELPPGARARGRAHGEALREPIRGHLDALMRNLDAGRATDPRGYMQDLLDGTDFLPAIRRETPQLLEEVEGIAEGAGLAFGDVFVLQLLDEEWAFSARRRAATGARDKCSAFAFADAYQPSAGSRTPRRCLARALTELGRAARIASRQAGRGPTDDRGRAGGPVLAR
jgi:hypothetical protein